MAFLDLKNLSNYYFHFFITKFLFFFNYLYTVVQQQTRFLPLYYWRSELMWQDGFLFDFLQKKTADAWVRQFVIYTGFIFSERLVFENIVRFYVDYLVWPFHYYSLFETKNVSEMLNIMIFFILTLFLIYISFYIILFV
jgi:hypothetical protein